MVCKIADAKRNSIKVGLGINKDSKTIAKEANVSLRTVYDYKKNMMRHGTVKPPKLVHQGRPRKLTPEMEECHGSELTVTRSGSRLVLFGATRSTGAAGATLCKELGLGLESSHACIYSIDLS